MHCQNFVMFNTKLNLLSSNYIRLNRSFSEERGSAFAKYLPRGPTLPQKAYEISKSLDFMEDFGISLKISRFHLRFPDFR